MLGADVTSEMSSTGAAEDEAAVIIRSTIDTDGSELSHEPSSASASYGRSSVGSFEFEQREEPVEGERRAARAPADRGDVPQPAAVDAKVKTAAVAADSETRAAADVVTARPTAWS